MAPRASRCSFGCAVGIALAPVVLLLASAIHAVVYGSASRPWAVGLVLTGLLVGVFNLSLTFRPALYRWKHGSMDGYRNVSGAPMVGTVLAMLGGGLGFGSGVCAVLGLVTLAIDTGGLPWFLVATWRDRSLRDS